MMPVKIHIKISHINCTNAYRRDTKENLIKFQRRRKIKLLFITKSNLFKKIAH